MSCTSIQNFFHTFSEKKKLLLPDVFQLLLSRPVSFTMQVTEYLFG